MREQIPDRKCDENTNLHICCGNNWDKVMFYIYENFCVSVMYICWCDNDDERSSHNFCNKPWYPVFLIHDKLTVESWWPYTIIGIRRMKAIFMLNKDEHVVWFKKITAVVILPLRSNLNCQQLSKHFSADKAITLSMLCMTIFFWQIGLMFWSPEFWQFLFCIFPEGRHSKKLIWLFINLFYPPFVWKLHHYWKVKQSLHLYLHCTDFASNIWAIFCRQLW